MSLPRYEKYKDSGVEWLGEVPEHWEIKRIKRLFEIKKRISGFTGYDVLSITQQGIKIKDIESGDGQLSMDYSKYQFVEIGDFAMNHMDLLTGYVDLSIYFGVTSPDYRVFTIRNSQASFDRYFLYLLQVGYRNKIFYAFGQGSSQLGRWRFPTEQFNKFEFPNPPANEQKKIANFLDQEITKIDDLIAESTNVIALLKEKRQALISHAVTKGLNPDVPMKDSGVEWLGEVPEHWEVRRFKHKTNIFPSNVDKKSYDDEISIKLCNYTNVYYSSSIKFDMDFMNATATEQQIRKFTLKAGDTIITKDSESSDDIAISAYVPKTLEGVICGYHLSIVRPKANVYGAFIKYLFDSRYAKSKFAVLANGLTRVGLGQYQLDNIEMPFPSFHEQQIIAQFLDQETTKIDDLIAESQNVIELLKERRSALISSAVTGKIDVRNYHA
jgi:type I restriction enzyme S subunit